MANFVACINDLQTTKQMLGGGKIIPPKEWTAKHMECMNSQLFDFVKVHPKAQSATKLIGGIFKLNNNPLSDIGKNSEIQLRVNLYLCSYLIKSQL